MQPAWPIRWLMFMLVLLLAIVITGSVSAAPPRSETSLVQSISLPWAMRGCWENEMFIPKSAARVAR
jgi:hypothetical protein